MGEAWETEIGNRAVNPPYAGQTLAQLVDELGEALLGDRTLAVFGRRFPLLAKFIDAHEKLSVQVHPEDAYSRDHEGGQLGKTEAWYILRADPDARLVLGTQRITSRDEVRRAIQEVRLEALLHSFVVYAGDVVFVPAGTVHAIGGGIVLYELQEYSDVTYRLYDYGRLQANGQPRELHVERGLDVMRYGPVAADTVRPVEVASTSEEGRRRVLVACRYFVLEELSQVARGELVAATQPTSCTILSVLAGEGEIIQGEYAPVSLRLGETTVLPARLGPYRLRGQGLRLLRSYVPTTDDALLRQWQAVQNPGIAL
jgi:mannose-6-phosphate isomerase